VIYTSQSHDFHGRKRKKPKVKGTLYKRMATPSFNPMTKPLYNYRNDDKQFPSAPDGIGAVASAPEAKRVEGYTVAIGYNKGGYQVIPDNEIKYIGK